VGDCSVIISVWWRWSCFNPWWPWGYVDTSNSWSHRQWWSIFNSIHQRLLHQE
jgi:hypothetical protein